MTNDDILAEVIRLIKAGEKDAAQLLLEPFLLDNPNHIQAWLWEAEFFPNDRDKIKVMEACLKQNPGHPQVIQALTFLKKRSDPNKQPATPVPTAPSFSVPSPKKPSPSASPFSVPPPVKSTISSSPFSVSPLEKSNPSSSPFSVSPPEKSNPLSSPFSVPPPEKSNPSSSPFFVSPLEKSNPSSSSPFLFDPVVPAPASQQTAADSSAIENPGLPQPPSPKKAKPQKKSKRMTPIMKNAIIAVMACIALFAIIGLYLGGGFYLNGEINKSFAGQNCADVVQHTSFVSLYPKGIFASMFTGHDQYAECRIKLDVEQAAAAKNWGDALSLVQQYLTAYPSGSFAVSISEQAPNFLSAWSGELIANHDYGNGIEKLKQLVEAYPDSPLAQPAPDVILQTYILWTKELTDSQDYAGAEQRLNSALSYFQADPARSEQIKQELANLYVDWGDMQIQLGDVDNAVNFYKKAGEISPGKIDIELLIARAYLQKAIDIGNTGNFNRALAEIKGISDAAQAENIKSEANAAREKILAAYSVSNSPQAMDQLNAAIPLACQGQRPELPIFGLDAEKIRFGLTSFYVKLPVELTAERPAELRYVICINNKDEEEIEICSYTGPIVGNVFLARMRYIWHVTLYDMLTGQGAGSKTFKGSMPDECPPKANFSVGSTVSKSYGKMPTADDIVAWLDSLNIAK